MIVGVFVYSFAVGSLTSLLSSVDLKKKKFNHFMKILLYLQKEYNIPPILLEKIRSHLKFG